MGVLFGRSIEIVTGLQGLPGYRITSFPPTMSSVASLSVDFQASYGVDGKPSKAHVSIINPPDAMISDILRGEEALLKITAGYGGRLEEVFTGVPIRDGTEISQTAGGDLQLKVAAVSGGARYRAAKVSRSSRVSVRAREVAAQIVEEAGWSMGRNDIPETLVYPRGFVAVGNASETIQKIAVFAGVDVAIAGNMVHFLAARFNPASSLEEAPLFSGREPYQNLVGTVAKTDKGLKFRGLLQGGLFPGQQVVLEHYDYLARGWVTSRIALREVTYTGSNYGHDFYVEGTGRVVRSGR